MLVFEEKGKPEYPEKNLSKQRREPTTNCNYVWSRRLDLNPGHIGEAFQGGFWCGFVAHFPIHLSSIWLETNVAVVFSLQYNCRCRFFARIQMFAKRECCAIFFFMFSHLTFNKKRQKSRADPRKTLCFLTPTNHQRQQRPWHTSVTSAWLRVDLCTTKGNKTLTVWQVLNNGLFRDGPLEITGGGVTIPLSPPPQKKFLQRKLV